MSKTVEDIGTLKINLLSQAQYDAEKAGGRLADDELYLTPSSGTGVSDVEVNGSSVVSGGVAEIELKTINQNSIVGSGDIEIQGGANVFIAEYDTTTYAEVKSAYDDDAVIICMVRDNDNVWVLQLTYYDDINDMFMFAEPYGQGCYWASVASDDTWNDGSFSFASTATATTSSNGLMSSSDKTKLNGIASGAEVNVQSNWSQSDSTADDYIKNKPTIPTITDTYSGTSSDGMSGKAVKSAIDALDGTVSGSAGAGKTLTAFSQTDGKVSATFGNISITKSQVSDFPAIPTITDTYSGTSSDGMSGKAVKSAIDALDGTVSGSAGAGKTLTAFSQTDGKVSATFGNISITKSQISDFPTIPTVNDATLTIQKNGTNVNTFTANASSNVTANITVPTDTGDLTNGAGFITTETDPIFTASPAYGITSSDITNWDNKVSDDKTWNGVTLNTTTNNPYSAYIPYLSSDSATTANLIPCTTTPSSGRIAEFDASSHLNSADMSAQDVSDFVDNLNVSGQSIEDAIASYLVPKTATVSGSTGALYLYRTGNVVYMSSNGAFRSKSSDIANNTTLTQVIPNGFKPKAYTLIGATHVASTNGRLEIETSGNIKYMGSTWNYNMYINGVWVTGDDMP